ncbi:hypothetical protein [Glutamicibacter sp.]|uniref:hypothetical protein n=1 Tax=Glutamicibacter sp. TaxID=1931995 RepID=UPI003D6AC778
MGELVSVDGFPLSGPARGGQWKILQLEGWWDCPPVKDQPEKRKFGDGSDRVPILYDERLITISGRFIARSHEALHAALNQVTSLAYRGGAEMVVEGHGPVQSARVDPRNPGIVANIRSDRYVSFVMPLVATDPYKYGEARAFDVAMGGTGEAFHRGTVEAWPNMIVTGDMPSYTIRFRGVDVEVPIGILPGQLHRIEYRTRRLYVDGSFVMGGFGSTNFRPVQAGIRSDLQLIAQSGSGQVKMTVNDTYI